MPYPALKVANELLQKHPGVTHMKLQKLLYYANGWWLATHGKPLLIENPQVWRYGPVFRGLYNTLSKFGHNEIQDPVSPGPFGGNAKPMLGDDAECREIRQLLEWLWDEHGDKSAIKLSDETHAVGTPWRTIAEQHNFKVPQNTEIKPKDDWAYFAKQAQLRGIQTVPLA